MSELQVTSIDSNGTFQSNTLTVGQTTINSTAIAIGSGLTINTSTISIGNSSVNTQLKSVLSEPSVVINGTTVTKLYSEVVNTQIFTADGTWTAPSWLTSNALVIVHMWGGGGGGNTNGGGGGGAFVFGYYKGNQVGATANVIVGLGGSQGLVGGTSSFANSTNGIFSAYGGGGCFGAVQGVGGGGGWFSAGSNTGTGGGAPLGGVSGSGQSTFGGGWSGESIYGGGGGRATSAGHNSIYGGGGGSGSSSVGVSIYGGSGGNNTVVPTTPGGGGGNGASYSYAGARGEVRVYTLRDTTV